MATLVVVIVDKDKSPIRTRHAPSVIDQVAQLAVVVDTQSDFGAISKFSHVSFCDKS